MPTIQRQSLRPLKAIGQSISIEKSEWKSRIEKKNKTSGPLRGTDSYSKTKIKRDTTGE